MGTLSRYLRHAPKNISRTSARVGLNIVLRLLPVLAQVADQALRAAGLAREAHVAPVQDEPVVRVLEKFGRRELEKLLLHLERSEEHTSELQSLRHLVCRLLLEKKK